MSIWGTLLKSVTSLIPGVGPIASNLIGDIGGGLLGKAIGGGPSGTTNANADQLAKNNLLSSQLGYDNAKKSSDLGFSQIQTAQDTFAQPQNYWQSILGGDQARTTQALAPQISQLQQRLNQTLQAGSTLNARGGGRASSLFSLPGQSTTAVNNLYNTAVPQAVAGLTDIGTRQGALGTSLLGSGTGFLSGSNSATATGLNNNILSQQQKFDQSKQLGGAIGGLLNGVNWGDLFKKGAASSGPDPIHGWGGA